MPNGARRAGDRGHRMHAATVVVRPPAPGAPVTRLGDMADLEISAVVVTTNGGTDVLEVQTRSVPAPGPGEVQIRVAASGINFIDVYERQGVYPVPTPFVLGKEGAGEVIAIGADVADRFELGDVVAWAEVRGSHSTVVNADADRLVPVPEGVPADLAAAAMLQGMTAQYLV